MARISNAASSGGDPNIARAGADWPAAVVACGHQTGLNLARNLERRGVRVFVIDANPGNDCFRSVYGKPVLCPDPDTQSDQWLQFMLTLAETIGGKPAIISGSDQFVSAVGLHADALAGKYHISPSAKMHADLAIKEGQIRLAMEHGLPIPRTRYAATIRDVEEFAAVCSYPCLFKPQQHRFWDAAPPGHLLFHVKVVVASNREELLEKYNVAAVIAPEVVLQEIIEGGEANKRCHVNLYGRDGERIGQCTTLEFRTYPKGYGVPSITEPVEDPEVAAACDKFCRNAGYHGICEIELKWDDRDGKVKMMDINPRYTGAGDAMPYAGFDHGWLHYLDLIGRKVEPIGATSTGFRHVMLRGDAAAVRQYWLAGEISTSQIWSLYRGPLYFYDFDWRDRKIAIATLIEVAKVALLTLKRFAQMGFRRPAPPA